MQITHEMVSKIIHSIDYDIGKEFDDQPTENFYDDLREKLQDLVDEAREETLTEIQTTGL